MKKYFLTIFVFLITAFGNALDVSGTLYGKHVWTKQNSPVVVTNNITVPVGSSLKIQPGVQVVFSGYYRFLIKGAFEAIGEKDQQIVFTCSRKPPQIAFWKGIVLYGTDCTAIISDCVVEYAFKNMCWETSKKNPVIIRHVTFRHNNYGLYCSNIKSAMILKNHFYNNNFGIYCDFSSPTIQGNFIINNDIGIYCIFSSAPLVGRNTLKGNINQDIFLDNSMGKNTITARNQYIWSLVRDLF